MSDTSSKGKKSHFKGGLLTGALFGIAAGIFMSSKQGKEMAKQLKKQATEVQDRIETELKSKKTITEKTYKESIDTVLAYYIKSKAIAKEEVPALRRYLLGKWKEVKKELANVDKPKAKPDTRRKTASKKKK